MARFVKPSRVGNLASKALQEFSSKSAKARHKFVMIAGRPYTLSGQNPTYQGIALDVPSENDRLEIFQLAKQAAGRNLSPITIRLAKGVYAFVFTDDPSGAAEAIQDLLDTPGATPFSPALGSSGMEDQEEGTKIGRWFKKVFGKKKKAAGKKAAEEAIASGEDTQDPECCANIGAIAQTEAALLTEKVQAIIDSLAADGCDIDLLPCDDEDVCFQVRAPDTVTDDEILDLNTRISQFLGSDVRVKIARYAIKGEDGAAKVSTNTIIVLLDVEDEDRGLLRVGAVYDGEVHDGEVLQESGLRHEMQYGVLPTSAW